jgi:hypothetical protein
VSHCCAFRAAQNLLLFLPPALRTDIGISGWRGVLSQSLILKIIVRSTKHALISNSDLSKESENPVTRLIMLPLRYVKESSRTCHQGHEEHV